jgi:hypothetical protein
MLELNATPIQNILFSGIALLTMSAVLIYNKLIKALYFVNKDLQTIVKVISHLTLIYLKFLKIEIMSK